MLFLPLQLHLDLEAATLLNTALEAAVRGACHHQSLQARWPLPAQLLLLAVLGHAAAACAGVQLLGMPDHAAFPLHPGSSSAPCCIPAAPALLTEPLTTSLFCHPLLPPPSTAAVLLPGLPHCLLGARPHWRHAYPVPGAAAGAAGRSVAAMERRAPLGRPTMVRRLPAIDCSRADNCWAAGIGSRQSDGRLLSCLWREWCAAYGLKQLCLVQRCGPERSAQAPLVSTSCIRAI